VWAVREVAASSPIEFGGAIREATADDTEAIIDFDVLLYDHQGASPSFSEFTAPPREEIRADVWADDAFLPFVAELDGRIVGLLGLYRRPEGDLRVPANNIDLAFAATRDDVRSSGAGLALTAFALDWAHEHGFHSLTVDWRSVNLLSSRFWPRRGFRPQYLRLYRAVP
jgi:GNAT superfamily N-acetyltransferase